MPPIDRSSPHTKKYRISVKVLAWIEDTQDFQPAIFNYATNVWIFNDGWLERDLVTYWMRIKHPVKHCKV